MKRLIILILVLMQISCTHSDSKKLYEEAVKLESSEDYDAYTNLLTKAANSGNIDAMATLGVKYIAPDCGTGSNSVNKSNFCNSKIDPKIGERLLVKAANSGNAYAIEWLVGIYSYYKVEGIETNYESAFYWANKSTHTARGLNEIGSMYERGIGTKVDIVKASKYYKKSIENGQGEESPEYWKSRSYESLAEIYSKGGNGLEISCEKSGYYFSKIVAKCEEYYISWYLKSLEIMRNTNRCSAKYKDIEDICPHGK